MQKHRGRSDRCGSSGRPAGRRKMSDADGSATLNRVNVTGIRFIELDPVARADRDADPFSSLRQKPLGCGVRHRYSSHQPDISACCRNRGGDRCIRSEAAPECPVKTDCTGEYGPKADAAGRIVVLRAHSPMSACGGWKQQGMRRSARDATKWNESAIQGSAHLRLDRRGCRGLSRAIDPSSPVRAGTCAVTVLLAELSESGRPWSATLNFHIVDRGNRDAFSCTS